MTVQIWRAKRSKTKEVFYKKLNTKRLHEDPTQRLLDTLLNDLQRIMYGLIMQGTENDGESCARQRWS